MIDQYVASLGPIVHINKIPDILQVNFSNKELKMPRLEKNITKSKYGKLLFERLHNNEILHNDIDQEIYVGRIYEPTYDFYIISPIDFSIPVFMQKMIASSFIDLGFNFLTSVCHIEYIIDFNTDENRWKDDPDEHEPDAGFMEICKRLLPKGRYRRKYDEYCNSVGFENIDLSLYKYIKPEIMQILERLQNNLYMLKKYGFNVLHHLYPVSDGLMLDQRFLIDTMDAESFKKIWREMNEIQDEGDNGGFIYDNRSDDLKYIELFIETIELTYNLYEDDE